MPAQRPRALALAAVLTLALAACGQTDGNTPAGTGADEATTQSAPATSAPADDAATSEPPTEDPVPQPTPIPSPGGGSALPTGPVPDSVRERPDVAEAIRAHAERAGVDPDGVTVEGFAEVTWSDGSLGCPQPGMMYTQALVPGYQLVLGVDGQLASYHAGQNGAFSYCANPVAPAQTGNPSS